MIIPLFPLFIKSLGASVFEISLVLFAQGLLSTVLLILFMLITGLWSTTWLASTAYLMDLTPTLKRGITIGFRQTAVRLGFTIGPLVGGYLWEAYGPIASFYASAIFFATSFVLVLLLKEQANESLSDAYYKVDERR